MLRLLNYLKNLNTKIQISTTNFKQTSNMHGTKVPNKTSNSQNPRNKVPKSAGMKLGFDCCALSLQPFRNHPVCCLQGHVFDFDEIATWLELNQNNLCPISNHPIKLQDLVDLHWYRNKDGKYHCPITFNVFSNHSHIVAIKSSGNVYSWEAVYNLNIKPKYWKDLLSDVDFNKQSDIITIYDPDDTKSRDISHFNPNVKSELSNDDDSNYRIKSSRSSNVARGNRLVDKIMKELDHQTTTDIQSSVQLKPVPKDLTNPKDFKQTKNPSNISKGKVAASLTSTSMPIVTFNESREIDPNEIMYGEIKKKGMAKIYTNFGEIKFELHCDKTPKTCFNFISLSKQGYYNNTKFHRLIPGFMIQAGDPSGTGKGGQSVWKREFEDEIVLNLNHNSRGTLSMANRGKDTNGSQFFITFGPCHHLDTKHTIFGQISGNSRFLDSVEPLETDQMDRPKKNVIIQQVEILIDPFEEYRNRMNNESKKKEKPPKKYRSDNTHTTHHELKPDQNKRSHQDSALPSWEGRTNPPKKKPALNVKKPMDFSSW